MTNEQDFALNRLDHISRRRNQVCNIDGKPGATEFTFACTKAGKIKPESCDTFFRKGTGYRRGRL